jgi:hypothetical protein
MRAAQRRLGLPLIAIAAALAVAGCGGGSTISTSKEPLGDVTVVIDPISGPPGTKIAWMASGSDCGRHASKYVSLDSGSEVGPNQREVAVRRTKANSGTLTVPKGTEPGDYHVSIECTTATRLTGLTFKEEAVAEVGFKVTGD